MIVEIAERSARGRHDVDIRGVGRQQQNGCRQRAPALEPDPAQEETGRSMSKRIHEELRESHCMRKTCWFISEPPLFGLAILRHTMRKAAPAPAPSGRKYGGRSAVRAGFPCARSRRSIRRAGREGMAALPRRYGPNGFQYGRGSGRRVRSEEHTSE